MKLSEIFLVCGLAGVIPLATNKFSQEPEGFIPMWSEQKGKGYETTLLNTHQIVSITPMFDPELILSRARNPKAEYLDVLLSSGITLKISEDYEEFKKRIRSSQ